jgi:phosphatidylserine synthase
LASAALALIARVSVFGEGGTAGAWITSILFWACLLGVLVASAARAFDSHRPHDRLAIAQWVFGAIAAVSFAVAGFVDTWVPLDVFWLALLGLIVTTVLRSRSQRSTERP